MRNTPMPVRGNLVEECVRVIRLRLGNGEWSSGLPGERTLAQIPPRSSVAGTYANGRAVGVRTLEEARSG